MNARDQLTALLVGEQPVDQDMAAAYLDAYAHELSDVVRGRAPVAPGPAQDRTLFLADLIDPGQVVIQKHKPLLPGQCTAFGWRPLRWDPSGRVNVQCRLGAGHLGDHFDPETFGWSQ